MGCINLSCFKVKFHIPVNDWKSRTEKLFFKSKGIDQKRRKETMKISNQKRGANQKCCILRYWHSKYGNYFLFKWKKTHHTKLNEQKKKKRKKQKINF